jgi:hypothetical protein
MRSQSCNWERFEKRRLLPRQPVFSPGFNHVKTGAITNAVKHFVAERRKPSGGFYYWTNRRACALPLKSFEFPNKKRFTALGYRPSANLSKS